MRAARYLLGAALLGCAVLPELGALAAQDQPAESCGEGLTPVEYRDATLCFDPKDGDEVWLVTAFTPPTQFIDGDESAATVVVTHFVSNGDTYAVADEKPHERSGAWKNADLGDTFGIRELR